MPRTHRPRWGPPHPWINSPPPAADIRDPARDRHGPRTHEGQDTRVHSAAVQRSHTSPEASLWEWDVQHLREDLRTELEEAP